MLISKFSQFCRLMALTLINQLLFFCRYRPFSSFGIEKFKKFVSVASKCKPGTKILITIRQILAYNFTRIFACPLTESCCFAEVMNFLLIPLPLLSPRNSMDPSALTPRIGTRTTVSWISIPLITTPSTMFTRVPASSTWRQNHQRKAPTIAARVSMTPPTTGCCLPRDRQPGSTLKNSVLSPHPT